VSENHDDDKTQSFTPLTKDTLIGHYRIIDKIGSGGMGEVYLAEDTKLKRQVALKFLPYQFLADENAKARFTREAQAAAKLNHPNIVTIYEVSEYQNRPFFAMECCNGRPLQEIIKEKKLSIDEAVNLAIQICEGSGKAHDAGIVHRDIKPSNIIVDSDGRAKLLDFGLATLKGNKKLTQTGSTLGTVGYMSPEQIEVKEIDQRSDLFSLGVVIYEMITARLPFKGDTDAATLNSILKDTPEPLSRYKSDIPDQLQQIVTKLLEKNQSYRYQTAAGVLSDLRRLSSKQLQPVKPIDKWNRYVIPSALVIVIAISIIWKFGYQNKNSTKKFDDKIMLAVLPFENLGNPADDYFADGITEEITTNLAKLSGLGVISRTSSMQYKNSDKNLKQIGRELKVDFILEGTIRWDKSNPDNRVRINPQLIRVSDDMHLWAESYEAVLKDIFGLQSSIAREVVTALDITLLGEENEALSLQYKVDPDAYDYYLQGKGYFSLEHAYHNQIDLAMKMHEKAVKIAPDFAPGYAELGSIHTEIYWSGIDPSSKRLDTAKYYIDKAKILAPNSPEVQQALGWYYYHGLRNFVRAVEIFKHVLKLYPNNSLAIASIAWVYRRQGKWDEAIELQKQAIRLDPRKSGYRHELGNTLMYKRNYEEALESFNLAIDLESDYYWAYASKSWALLNLTGDVSQSLGVIEQALINSGRKPTLTFFEVYYNLIDGEYEHALNLNNAPGEIYLWGNEGGYDYFYFKGVTYYLMKNKNMAQIYFDSARVILEGLVSETPNSAPYLSALARVYECLGRKDDAVRIGRRAIEIEPVSIDALDGSDHVRDLMIVYARVGESDLAIDQLEYLLRIPSAISIKWAKIAPELAPIRDYPRFQALIEKYEKRRSD